MTTTGLIAKKVGMTRMMDPEGHKMMAVTLLKVEANKVTKILNPERDGYTAVQVGYQEKKESRLSKPDISRLRKAGVNENFAKFKEFRYDAIPAGVEVGSVIGVDSLEGVTAVDVTGLTKGRGFQGTTKRYNTKTGRKTHGSRFHRRPGSLGQRATPGRVYKNKKNPGHMGTEQRTIQNLRVMDVDTQAGTIAVRGSIPGNRESFVIVKPSIKAK